MIELWVFFLFTLIISFSAIFDALKKIINKKYTNCSRLNYVFLNKIDIKTIQSVKIISLSVGSFILLLHMPSCMSISFLLLLLGKIIYDGVFCLFYHIIFIKNKCKKN